MKKARGKTKSREPIIAKTAFFMAMLVEIFKIGGGREMVNDNFMILYPILMIFFTLAFALTYSDSWIAGITHTLVGFALYFSITYALVLFGTIGLSNDSENVIEGLSRISAALFVIWKLHSDMRHVNLTLKPGRKNYHPWIRPFYGILWPRKEFGRLLKILIYLGITFVLLTSGMELIEISNVNPNFLDQTTKISNNILFIGLQSPLLMASRNSVSRTFSNFLDNYSELVARYQNNADQLNVAISGYLDVKTLSYSQINANGKHLWLSVIIIFFLETFKDELIILYNSINIGLVGFLSPYLPFP